MKELREIVKLMLREKKDIFLSVLFGFIAGIAAVALFANSGYLISMAAITPPLYILTITMALMKVFSVTRALSKYGERLYSHRATFNILGNLREHFFKKLEPLAPQLFNKYRSGDLLARIVGDIESLQHFFLRVYYPPIVMIIVFLSTIAFTSFFSKEIAIVLVIGLLLTGFVVPVFFAWKQKKIDRSLRVKRSVVSTEATEFLYGFRDLKLYQQLDEKEKELVLAGEEYVKEQRKENTFELYSQSVNQGFSLIIMWSVLTLGAFLVSRGELEGVFLAMLVMISLTLFENSTPMAAVPSHFENSRTVSKRLYSVLKDGDDLGQLSQLEEEKLLVDKMNPNISIELKNVTFRFSEEERDTVFHVSLSFPAGSKTAIVGPSGSGKSTLLQLILKLYDDYQGHILIGEKNIRNLQDTSIWEQINVVLQSNHFFYGTVRDNLLLAKEDASEERLMEVLEKVHLHALQLDDEVLEKGENLSGGEKQRLAIARVMLKNAPIWLLDEPTSSVDAITEKEIHHELLRMGKEDTMIFVSHRLTGLEKMDQIVVMDQGEVIEVGKYEELMSNKGYFYDMKQIERSIV